MAERGMTWAVVALADEPAQLVAAFARHHHALGASDVFIFLDRPNPEVARLIGTRPGIHITTCDQAFWDQHNGGERPERHTGRQKRVATLAYNTTSCDWLLHCDADEFIRDGDALQQQLQCFLPDTPFVLRNSERVYMPENTGETIFEGGFRHPMWLTPEDAKAAYGRFAKFMDDGFTGHRVGKTIVPTGLPFSMGVHHPLYLNQPGRPEHGHSSGRLLLHFDGLTPLHYAIKLLKKAFENYSGPKRKIGKTREAQYRFVRNHANRPAEIWRLVKGVQFLSGEQVAMLSVAQNLEETSFFPQDCDDMDLSQAAFDAVLRDREHEILSRAGFDPASKM